MLKGGYILIDCKGYNLLGDPATIDGIYDACIEALHLNKPVFAYNMLWGTAEMTPIAVMLTTADDRITATASTLQLVIDEDDTVTVNNLIQ